MRMRWTFRDQKVGTKWQLNQRVSNLKIYEFGFAMFVGLSFRFWWRSRNFKFSICVDGFEFSVVVMVWGLGYDGGGFVWMLVCLAVGGGVIDGGRFCWVFYWWWPILPSPPQLPIDPQSCPHLPTIATNHQWCAERKDQDLGLIWVWCF